MSANAKFGDGKKIRQEEKVYTCRCKVLWGTQYIFERFQTFLGKQKNGKNVSLSSYILSNTMFSYGLHKFMGVGAYTLLCLHTYIYILHYVCIISVKKTKKKNNDKSAPHSDINLRATLFPLIIMLSKD